MAIILHVPFFKNNYDNLPADGRYTALKQRRIKSAATDQGVFKMNRFTITGGGGGGGGL